MYVFIHISVVKGANYIRNQEEKCCLSPEKSISYSLFTLRESSLKRHLFIRLGKQLPANLAILKS